MKGRHDGGLSVCLANSIAFPRNLVKFQTRQLIQKWDFEVPQAKRGHCKSS
jgi:hypothetical protein